MMFSAVIGRSAPSERFRSDYPVEIWDYRFKERFLTGVFVRDGCYWIELLLIAVDKLDIARWPPTSYTAGTAWRTASR